MGNFIPAIATIMLGGFLTLFSTVYIGGDPFVAAPLSLLCLAITWIAHDLVHYFGRRHRRVRIILTWAFTGQMRAKLREIGASIVMFQLWSIVSIVPAILTWFAVQQFPNHLPHFSFGQCFLACFFMEAAGSIFLDLPAGFLGVFYRVRDGK